MKDMKFDGGKLKAGILLEDFPLALRAISEVATFGANKYERNSWKTVANAKERYGDAFARHYIEKHITPYDEESGLLHATHLAWNALALLQLELEANDTKAEEPVVDATTVLPKLGEPIRWEGERDSIRAILAGILR